MLLGAFGCSRPAPPPAPPPLPPTTGTLALEGLTAPVRVVRDRVGVPHIYASNTADLFFAQGFVQAQDRLFQMDLWRRAAQGRLAEVLGANFIDRDAMTRRIQYRGDPAAEWASYGPDARTIAEAFVQGINAWVSMAREHPPEEFVQAGWPPAYWRAEDLLNRTDAFLASAGALESIERQRLPAVVADAVRFIGTPPFLVGAAPAEPLTRVFAAAHAEAAAGRVGTSEAPPRLSAPAARYLVHLAAPGWNVVGATAPWLPGVAVGHTDRVAWAMEPLDVETEEVVVEPADAVVARDPQLMRIKGRPQMLPFTRDVTRDGVVIASDMERQRVFVLRWRGFEPGMAAGLGALALGRARDWPAFRDAAKAWRMPARRIVYGDVDGRVEQIATAIDGGRTPRPAAGSRRPGEPRPDTAVFPHLMRRFEVGPLQRPADDAPLQLVMDATDWDLSQALSAPGQSGAPSSPHYRDAAARWSAGLRFDLWFSEDAVRASAEATLTLIPAPRR